MNCNTVFDTVEDEIPDPATVAGEVKAAWRDGCDLDMLLCNVALNLGDEMAEQVAELLYPLPFYWIADIDCDRWSLVSEETR